MEVKSGLESFETRDMEKLIQFHESIEMVLEQLTDESQVIEGVLVHSSLKRNATSIFYFLLLTAAHTIT